MSLSLAAIITEVVTWAPTVKALWDEATSNDSFLAKVEKLSPTLGSIIQTVGADLFPNASATLQKIGAVVASFDPNTTKWLQSSINTVLGTALSPPLVVDGIYGPKTIAAVQQIQTKLGLTVDGIAGQITQGALQAVLSKLPTLS